ncbi:hypothetical protein BCR42DRAFT_333077 [Absidia repens]|uniref:CYK3 C-terminal Ig-like domain-containing protein n=1 Tax=Absidia repens TaxID=90262 RepID=A0A1X2I7S6_9FUNG|nr:hypothetical protein BCR42DRAFT_333077 [Absidia repens]
MDLTNERTNSDDGGDEVTLIQNHAWCYVKVEGEYRFVDCWLASPFQPQNKHKAESTHWFLTKPSHMIYTHFPQEPSNQCLEPTIDVSTFFALPYVWASFFLHHIKMIRYNPDAMSLVDDDHVCHLTFRVDPGIACFAFVETDRFSNHSNQPTTITMRCLAQSRLIPDEKTGLLERVFKIKAILPPGHDGGWLKIYAGASSSATVNATTIVPANDSLPPLAVCFRLTASQQERCGNNRVRPFEFVHLHPCRHEFYIREPQCYFLYPLQTYNFLVRGGDDTHHKLAIKSPGGKLYKLMYYPQEHTYDGSVKISETGKWSLISLLHNAGGWYVVASWECRG